MVDDRNYDFPASGVGTSLPNQVQGTYNEGSLIDFEVVVSAHHKGHFMYKVSTSIMTVRYMDFTSSAQSVPILTGMSYQA